MSSSLDKLVSNLPNEALPYTSEKFKGRKVDLMAKKGKPSSSICYVFFFTQEKCIGALLLFHKSPLTLNQLEKS